MIEFLSQPFVLRALVAGLAVGIAGSFFGVFVILKKMSFFVDGIAHSALAGIALGLLFEVDPILAALAFAILVALGMGYIKNQLRLSFDTIIGIFFPAAFSVGVIIIGLLSGYRPELISYLFGNILAVTTQDLVLTLIVVPLALLPVILLYKRFVFSMIDSEMAKVQGIPLYILEMIFLVALAALVVVSLKVLGIILVGALVVIPAAAAKNVSSSFSEMISFAMLFAVISVILGLVASYYLDVASGASIVLTAVVIFVFTFLVHKARA